MQIAVLGTGVVGTVLASAFIRLGHAVRLGARDAANERATEWATGAGASASHGTFADAAAFGSLIVNATSGGHSLEALHAAGDANLAGKTLLDAANPLDFSDGFPPRLSVVNDDSLGERIQRQHPDARVVKALNTVANPVMVDPGAVGGGDHDLFICGDYGEAKTEVRGLLHELGWADAHIRDLGGIECARGTEMYLALWVRVMRSLGGADFNVRVVR